MKFTLHPHPEVVWLADYRPSRTVRFALWCIRMFSLDRAPLVASFRKRHEQRIVRAPFCRALLRFLGGCGTFSASGELEKFLADWPRVAAALGLKLAHDQNHFEVVIPCILMYREEATNIALMRLVNLPVTAEVRQDFKRDVENFLIKNRQLVNGFPPPGSEDFRSKVEILGPFSPTLMLPAMFDHVVAGFVAVGN